MKKVDAPLITVNGISLAFGGPPLIESADFSIHNGERVCLVDVMAQVKVAL